MCTVVMACRLINGDYSSNMKIAEVHNSFVHKWISSGNFGNEQLKEGCKERRQLTGRDEEGPVKWRSGPKRHPLPPCVSSREIAHTLPTTFLLRANSRFSIFILHPCVISSPLTVRLKRVVPGKESNARFIKTKKRIKCIVKEDWQT